jgi:2,3-bisphosphoglycerate-independent phosphoglycerate mutase
VVEALVILDGASEPLGFAPTSLERARTPALDALGRDGGLSRVRTVAPWLSPGSEAAIPALLGWTPPAPVDRGAVEAAAHGIVPAAGERAWRVDVVAGPHRRAGEADVLAAAARLAAGAPGHVLRRLAGHRLLLVGPPPLPAAAHAPGLRAWPEGVVPGGRDALLDGDDVVVVAAAGAAAGVGRLLGATVVVPPGATGGPGSDLPAKTRAARAAIDAGVRRVVVHVGGPDEAAHERDAGAKVAAIEAADAQVVGPLAEAVRAAGGTLTVCPDHGCDPATGEHDAAPVPSLGRPPFAPAVRGRLTERAVAGLPVVDLHAAVAA